MNRRLLVTGGAGFIGANFVHHWCQAYPNDRLVVLDALTYAGNRHNLASVETRENFRFVQGDISDRSLVDKILLEENIDTIAHFAAESHVDRSITEPGAFVQTNVVGTFTLLEAFRQHWNAKTQPSNYFFMFLQMKFMVVSPQMNQHFQKLQLIVLIVPIQPQKPEVII
jgi:dTDP-glucose 4,6-dehydratase